jgi:hypothetical protein
VKLRSFATSALAVGLSALSLSTATATATALESDASRKKPLGQFLAEQARNYQLARNPELASKASAITLARIEIPDAKALLERAGRTRVTPPTIPTNDEIVRRLVVMTYQMMLANANSCCPCSSASTCNDGLFCNGAELCVSGGCAPGPPACNDNNSCTSDTCVESTDSCSHNPPPPPAVARLDLSRSAPASPVATLAWTPVAGATSYNIYRSAFPNLGGLACFRTGVTGTSQNDDGALPAPGFYFLVSSLACSESGLGDGSATSRPPAPGCP